MAVSQLQRTIVVIGATGRQGGGVVKALLSDKSVSGDPWLVRGFTSDPGSDKAKQLLSDLQTEDGRLSLVRGSVYDVQSLLSAFAGAYGVFAMTDQGYPGRVLVEEEELKHELDAGRNLIDAAKERGIKHFVFSSTPSISKASGGRFTKVFHMDHKYAIEQMASAELDGFTAIIPGFFYTNLQWPLYSRLQADGVVRFCIAVPEDQPIQWVDPSHDMGAFTAKVFSMGVEETNKKSYHALSSPMTPKDIIEIFAKVTGKKAIHSPISADEFGQLAASYTGPALREDSKQMMEWAAVAPRDQVCYGAVKPGAEGVGDLGFTGSSFEDWLTRSGWTGPTEVYEPSQQVKW